MEAGKAKRNSLQYIKQNESLVFKLISTEEGSLVYESASADSKLILHYFHWKKNNIGEDIEKITKGRAFSDFHFILFFFTAHRTPFYAPILYKYF